MSGGVTQASRLNLARRPFQNRRPLKRLAVLLWIVVAGLTVLNGYLYYRHFSGSRLTKEQQAELRVKIAEEENRLAELEAELADLRVASTNAQARDLNALIVERAFSWSRLFDQLTEAMPGGVRLATLTPNFAGRQRGARRSQRQEADPERVSLEIRGSARNDTVMLEFVDRLFEHESFFAPNLRSESREENGQYVFAMDVVYHPTAPAEEADVEEAAPGEPESEPEGDDDGAAASVSAAGDD